MTVVGLNKNIVITAIQVRLILLTGTMKDAIRKVVNDNNSDFNLAVSTFETNLFTIIINNTVNEGLETLFNTYDLVGENPRDRYLLARELFNFGEDLAIIQSNPELKESLLSVNLNIQNLSMALGYDNAAQITYESTEDLDSVIDSLETNYNRILKSELLDVHTRDALVELRTGTMGLFSNLELRSINTITTNIRASRLLSYDNYGTSQESGSIVSLNNASNTPFIEGDINILSNI